MSTRHVFLLLSIAFLASFVGAMAWRWVYLSPLEDGAATNASSGQLVGDLLGSPRPDYTLGRDDGARVSASEFDGKVVLLNFWATWCKPCREEMPMLVGLNDSLAGSGLQVVGIALDDVAQAREFAAQLGVNYPVLVGSTDVMAAVRLYGNLTGVLPYSVLIGRDGIIRWTHLGVLDEDELIARIRALL